MAIYFICFGISIIISLFVINEKSYIYQLSENNRIRKIFIRFKDNKIWDAVVMTLSGLPLFLLAAFRYGIGTDYFGYSNLFLYLVSGDENRYVEPGYHYLNWFITLFTDNPQWVFAITSLIFVLSIYWAIYNSKEDLPYVIALIFSTAVYFQFYNNIRQMMASAIILLGLSFLKKNKLIVFFIFVIIGCLIHQATILLLIFLIFRKFKIDYRLSIIFPILFLSIRVFFIDFIVDFLMKFEKYASYIVNGTFAEKTISNGTYLLQIFIFILLIGTKYFHDKKNHSLNEETEGMDRVFIFMQAFVLCAIAFDGVIPSMYRVMRLFTFAQIIYIPYFINKFDNGKLRILLKLIVLLGFSYICIKQVFIWGSEEVVPYISIFDF